MAAEIGRREAALAWVQRIHDPSFDDWDAHLGWLEEDPANSAAFDQVSLMVEQQLDGLGPAAPLPPQWVASNDNPVAERPHWRGRWSSPMSWAAGAATGLAAALILMLIPWHATDAETVLRTRTGETRLVALADGTRIALNGDTLLRISGAARSASLERGQAFFTVAHDDARPFRVVAGAVVLQDVGTAFDVVRHGSVTNVAVREGQVLFDPDGQKLTLGAGRGLRISGDTAAATAIDPGTVGGWRAGRLVYRDDAIGDLAEDLGRSTGEPIRTGDGVASRRFTGVVVIDRDRPLMFRRLAAVTGLAITHDATGWRLALPGR